MSDDLKPDQRHFPMQGIEIWKNKKNRFCVMEIHYSADPGKRAPEWKEVNSASIPRRDWLREYELSWETWEGLPVYADWDTKIHGNPKIIDPHLGLPLFRGWDFGLCYSDDTEILTDSGWKYFKDLLDDDKVATANPETWELEYVKPTRRHVFDYAGELLEWKNQNLNLKITPEHIVPYSKRESPSITRWASAEQLSKEMTAHRYVQLTTKWSGELFIKNPLELNQITFARLMGMYLSEGSTDENRITIYQKEKKLEWDEVLKSTGFKWIRTDKGKAAGWRLYDKKLTQYFKSFGNAKDKRIPREILNGSRPVLEEFLRFYSEGDGHIRIRENGSEEHTIFTTSKAMADDLQELSIKLGWTASIRLVKPSSSFMRSENRLIKSSGGYRIHFKKSIQRAELLAESFNRVSYNGKIYCVSVPYHTLLVRREGTPSWNGNTPAAVVCQLQEEKLVAIKEFVGFNIGITRFSEIVLNQCKQLFPLFADLQRDWREIIDPAGFAKKDTDEKSCADVLKERRLNVMAGEIAFTKRKEAVEGFLTKRTKDGPCLQVSLSDCPMLVRGFKGGYQYPEYGADMKANELRPVKNEFSHIHDAFQMVASIFGKKSRKSGVSIRTPGYSSNRNYGYNKS